MQLWFPWLLGFIAAFGASNFLFHGLKKKEVLYLIIGTAYFFLGLSGVAQALSVFNESFNNIERTSWFIRFCDFAAHAFIYTALAVLIRKVKPEFARFPILFAALPLLLLAVFPLATSTPVIIDWVELMLQIGGLLSTALVLIVLARNNAYFYRFYISLILFLIAFVSIHIVHLSTAFDYIPQIFFLLGLVSFSYLFDHLINNDISLEPDFIPQPEND